MQGKLTILNRHGDQTLAEWEVRDQVAAPAQPDTGGKGGSKGGGKRASLTPALDADKAIADANAILADHLAKGYLAYDPAKKEQVKVITGDMAEVILSPPMVGG